MYEGNGIGANLLAKVEDYAIQAGLDKIHLKASLHAAPFYKHKGFKEIGPSTQELADGRLLASIAMEKTTV